jgi:hypothetical protein
MNQQPDLPHLVPLGMAFYQIAELSPISRI